MAGLYAGYVLQYLGVGGGGGGDDDDDDDQVQILEANPTSFGGRVREVDTKDFDVGVSLDMGAEWIHGHPSISKDLLLFEDDTDEDMVKSSSSSSSLPQTIIYDPQTFKTYFNGKQRSMNFAKYFYSEYKFYNTTWFDYIHRFIYPYVAYNVKLDAAVTTIDYSYSSSSTTMTGKDDNQQYVQVTLHDGRVMEADYVIVAAPISQLQGKKSTNVRFVPPVPMKKQQAWDSIYFAPGIKLFIEFDTKFYPDIQFVGRRLNNGGTRDGNTLYFDALFKKDEYNKDRHVLAYLGVNDDIPHLLNEAAKRINNSNSDSDSNSDSNSGSDNNTDDNTNAMEQAVFELMMEELDEIYDGKATKHYVQHYVKIWSNDPYIGGAYTVDSITESLVTELQAPIGNNRIYFCGEYAHYYDSATVHGAALSAREAVEQLIKDHSTM